MNPILNDLFTVLSFPSISTDSDYAGDVRNNAEWLHEKLSSLALETETHETEKHPIVVAKNPHLEGRINVLLYGHYDVQPVDPVELWDTPPFEPTLKG